MNTIKKKECLAAPMTNSSQSMKQGSKQTNINKPFSFPKRGGGRGDSGIIFYYYFFRTGFGSSLCNGGADFCGFCFGKEGGGGRGKQLNNIIVSIGSLAL